MRPIAALEPLTRIKWERLRDDTSQATAYVATPSADCNTALGLIEAGRVELVIFRGMERVWEGPVTHITYQGASVEVTARDVTHYINRTIMRGEYDNRYPRVVKVLDRLKRILPAELARKEALDPPINVVPHLTFTYATDAEEDAKTAAHTLPYEMTVFEHMDALAARGGIDYTTVGRRIIFNDVHHPLGQGPALSQDDFIGGDLAITQYGMELTTLVAMTDGKGHYGLAGANNDTGIDDYYGEWEVVFQAYDENAGTGDTDDPEYEVDVSELKSQAQRAYVQGKRPPLVVRVPDNTRVNPKGVLTVADLVPGMWFPLSATIAGRTLSQMQKLDNMSVEETAKGGEVIKVTLSAAPIAGVDKDLELGDE
jgi:hypothetical protein